MARRSYLQRIAEPVRPGDPLLFAMPHAAPDEARPPAVPQVAATTITPSSAPVLRRAPVLRSEPARGVPPLAPAALPTTPSAQVPAITAPASAVSGELPNAALSLAPVPVVPAQPLGPRPAAEPGMRAASAQAAHLPPAPGARHEEAAAADFVGPPSPATDPAASAPAAGRRPTAFHPAPIAAEPAPYGELAARSVVGHAEPAMRPPASPAAPPPNNGAAAASPRIHIGTVEVRSAAPAPSHAAPRSEAAPISRAYAWRFGLVQG